MMIHCTQVCVTVYVPSSFGVHVVWPMHVSNIPESIKHAQNEQFAGNGLQLDVTEGLLPLFERMSQNSLAD
jgi:hypothetical protein